MAHLSQMSGTGTAARKAAATVKIKNPAVLKHLSLIPDPFPDEPIVPILVPKRLSFRPSIPAKDIRRAVFKVVRERQAKEREAALNGKNSE